MSPPEKSGNTAKSTSSRESGGSRSRSKWPTLGEVAAYARLDFHARICQSPAEVKDLKERPVDSGGKPLQPLAGYDQKSSSWRMLHPSLLEESEPFSGRWPRSGIVLNGIAYRLDTLAHRTKGIASGLSELEMWPTPRARDHKDGESVPPSRVKSPNKATLGQSVQMWPTPNACRGNNTGRMDEWGGSGNPLRGTPLSRGPLNPPFVEWLMGYPIGFTDLVD